MSESRSPRHNVWRLLVVVSLSGILIQSVTKYRTRQVLASNTPTAAIAVGDVLADVPLRIHGDTGGGRMLELSQLVAQASCSVLIFFDSSCPICVDMAYDWRRVRELDQGGSILPVKWIALESHDKGAQRFVATDSLAETWYSVTTHKDLAALGIEGSPSIYLVNRQRRFGGMVASATPRSLRVRADSCQLANESERTRSP